jgi:hypothetical protein
MSNYVFENIEVRKTGRVAQRRIGNSTKVQQVVEITPVSSYDGDWKKWVAPDILFSISDEVNTENKSD